MDESLCDTLLRQHENDSHYNLPLIIDGVDVSSAIGDNASTPKGAKNQPTAYPKNYCYCFDCDKYSGEDSYDDILQTLKNACSDCYLYRQKCDLSGPFFSTYELRCSCYKVQEKDMSQFDEGCFQKRDTKVESVKKQRSTNQCSTVDRMQNKKMSSKGMRKKRNKQRSIKNRSGSRRARSKESRCNMYLKLMMDKRNGKWYLGKSGSLQHSFHQPLPAETRLLDESNLSEDQLKWVEKMYQGGISHGSIAGVLNEVLTSEGTNGEFLASTIKNMTENMQKAIDEIAGISADMSVAERSFAVLNE